jgi:hypothetical protein
MKGRRHAYVCTRSSHLSLSDQTREGEYVDGPLITLWTGPVSALLLSARPNRLDPRTILSEPGGYIGELIVQGFSLSKGTEPLLPLLDSVYCYLRSSPSLAFTRSRPPRQGILHSRIQGHSRTGRIESSTSREDCEGQRESAAERQVHVRGKRPSRFFTRQKVRLILGFYAIRKKLLQHPMPKTSPSSRILSSVSQTRPASRSEGSLKRLQVSLSPPFPLVNRVILKADDPNVHGRLACTAHRPPSCPLRRE